METSRFFTNNESYFPIRVLKNNIFTIYQQYLDGITEEKHLFSGIPINYVYNENIEFEVNGKNEIVVSEYQCQFLWSCSYALAICEPYFENGIIHTDIFVQRAFDLICSFQDKSEKHQITLYYDLPNPLQYCLLEKPFIEKANGYYFNALEFILLHEYQHITQNLTQSNLSDKEKEIDADNYAVRKICKEMTVPPSKSFDGFEAAWLYLLLKDNSDLHGDKMHGSPIDRIQNMATTYSNVLEISSIRWQLVFSIWNVLSNNHYCFSGNNSLKRFNEIILIIKRNIM